MSFIDVRDNLISFLGTEADGAFTVIGYKPQDQSADNIVTTNQISVVYRSGENPTNINAVNRNLIHVVNFELILVVASPITVDLSTINDPSSTESQIATAISNKLRADQTANNKWDTFYKAVLTIIMSPKNRFLDNPVNTISDRWLSQVKKEDPETEGEYVIVMGKALLTLKCVETMDNPDLETTLDIIRGDFYNVSNDEQETDEYTKTEVEETY